LSFGFFPHEDYMPPIVSLRTAAGLLCLLPLVVTGCGSSASSGGDDNDSPDAAGADSAGEEIDGATSPDAGSPPSFVSNVPGATVVSVGNPPMPDLVLLSLNFLQTPSGSQYFQEWFGELENVGSSAICFPQIAVAYEGPSGATLLTMNNSYADAASYTSTGATLPVPCIPPGEIGSFYQNNIADAAGSTSGVTTLAVTFASLTDADAVPDPNAPILTSTVESTSLGYEVSGTIAESTGTISNIGYRAYPRDATGLVMGHLQATDLGVITPSTPFSFTSEGLDTPFTQYREYTDYIEGAGTGTSVAMPTNPHLAAAAADRRGTRAATEARRRSAEGRR
jgi:hypothetical protein